MKTLKPNSPWWYILNGEEYKGIEMFHNALAEVPSPGNKTALGIAYVFTRRYDEAYRHFIWSIASSPATSSSYYIMAGMAKWCTACPREAVELWKAGLKAKYADAAGGAEIPLLLYYVSLVDSSLFARADADALLKKRIADPRMKNWPGPVARYVLGLMDMPHLLEECARQHMGDCRYCEWYLSFYTAIQNRGATDTAASLARMREIVEEPHREKSGLVYVPDYIRRPEYYLARREVDVIVD